MFDPHSHLDQYADLKEEEIKGLHSEVVTLRTLLAPVAPRSKSEEEDFEVTESWGPKMAELPPLRNLTLKTWKGH